MVLLYFDECTCSKNRKKDEIKEDFYNSLEQSINEIANSNIKIIPGDSNAKVGKENIYKPNTGNESLHNQTNNSGRNDLIYGV